MLCKQALEIAEKGQNACISFVCYKQNIREFIKSLIPDIKIIHLKVDEDILVEKTFVRTQKQLEQSGMSIETVWKMDVEHMNKIRAKYGEEYTKERYSQHIKDMFYVGLDEHKPDELNCFVINNTEYGKAGIK
jgi:gluconate kinase